MHDKKERFKQRSSQEIPHRNETIQQLTTRRINKLKNMFNGCGHEIKFIGDPEKPGLIMDDKIILNAFVHNFKLYFTSAPDGDIIHEFTINTATKVSRDFLDEFLENYNHRECYRIRLIGTDLYLSGYNFVDKNEKSRDNRYPVFARITEKYYFSRYKAQEIVNIHPDYNLEII